MDLFKTFRRVSLKIDVERHWRPLNVDFFIGFSEVQECAINVDFNDVRTGIFKFDF